MNDAQKFADRFNQMFPGSARAFEKSRGGQMEFDNGSTKFWFWFGKTRMRSGNSTSMTAFADEMWERDPQFATQMSMMFFHSGNMGASGQFSEMEKGRGNPARAR